MNNENQQRPPFPPFTRDTAIQKVRAAEDGWNGKNPAKVALAYTTNSQWRNRDQFITGREEITQFLDSKWKIEKEYRLIKELWAFEKNRIAVRFAYEWCDDKNQWFRSYGNENWEFDANGLMQKRYACINDLRIENDQRLFLWTEEKRPSDHPGLSDLNL